MHHLSLVAFTKSSRRERAILGARPPGGIPNILEKEFHLGLLGWPVQNPTVAYSTQCCDPRSLSGLALAQWLVAVRDLVSISPYGPWRQPRGDMAAAKAGSQCSPADDRSGGILRKVHPFVNLLFIA
jgi:hypothetical protein